MHQFLVIFKKNFPTEPVTYSLVEMVQPDTKKLQTPLIAIGDDVETVYFTLANGEEIEFSVDHGPVPIED